MWKLCTFLVCCNAKIEHACLGFTIMKNFSTFIVASCKILVYKFFPRRKKRKKTWFMLNLFAIQINLCLRTTSLHIAQTHIKHKMKNVFDERVSRNNLLYETKMYNLVFERCFWYKKCFVDSFDTKGGWCEGYKYPFFVSGCNAGQLTKRIINIEADASSWDWVAQI